MINSSLVEREPQRPDLTAIKVPANKIAEEAGAIQVTNMAALGAYVEGRGVVSLESVIVALRRMIPEHRQELLAVNEKALRKGAEVAAAQK
ncbi:MAG: 2-oxoacid:acceptor oxidoreductase family protein [Pseudomonadota bacterium]